MLLQGQDGKSARLYLPKDTATWSIEGLFSGGNTDGNAVLYSLEVNDVESLDIRRCFNETNHIFTFGRDVLKSSITVSVLLFLGEMCQGGSASTPPITLESVRNDYEQHRVSKLTESLQIEYDGVAFRGFLCGMTIGNMDPRLNTCLVTYTFIVDADT